MRGYFIVRAGTCSEMPLPGGPVQVLEYVAGLQRRITRSTFAAELMNALDAIGLASVIEMADHEIRLATAQQLA